MSRKTMCAGTRVDDGLLFPSVERNRACLVHSPLLGSTYEETVAINVTYDCGRKLEVRDEFAGRDGMCPACGHTFLIPAPGAASVSLLLAGAVEIPEADADSARTEKGSAEEHPPRRDHGGKENPPDADFFVDPP